MMKKERIHQILGQIAMFYRPLFLDDRFVNNFQLVRKENNAWVLSFFIVITRVKETNKPIKDYKDQFV